MLYMPGVVTIIVSDTQICSVVTALDKKFKLICLQEVLSSLTKSDIIMYMYLSSQVGKTEGHVDEN